jgi:DNA-binding transcriptional ArsR family regulator
MADDRLSVIFGALADPTRRAILARLAGGQATVTEPTAPFPISMPAISRHLKVLGPQFVLTHQPPENPGGPGSHLPLR